MTDREKGLRRTERLFVRDARQAIADGRYIDAITSLHMAGMQRAIARELRAANELDAAKAAHKAARPRAERATKRTTETEK